MAEEKNIATGYIGNALRSSAADHTTTFTDEVFDTERQKYQSEVNTDIEERIEAESEARDLAINNETQARTQNDQLLSQAIAAEQERAEAAEKANATAINGGEIVSFLYLPSVNYLDGTFSINNGGGTAGEIEFDKRCVIDKENKISKLSVLVTTAQTLKIRIMKLSDFTIVYTKEVSAIIGLNEFDVTIEDFIYTETLLVGIECEQGKYVKMQSSTNDGTYGAIDADTLQVRYHKYAAAYMITTKHIESTSDGLKQKVGRLINDVNQLKEDTESINEEVRGSIVELIIPSQNYVQQCYDDSKLNNLTLGNTYFDNRTRVYKNTQITKVSIALKKEGTFSFVIINANTYEIIEEIAQTGIIGVNVYDLKKMYDVDVFIGVKGETTSSVTKNNYATGVFFNYNDGSPTPMTYMVAIGVTYEAFAGGLINDVNQLKEGSGMSESSDINGLLSKYDVVTLAPKDYIVSSPIILNSGKTLKGSFGKTRLLLADGCTTAITASNADNIIISDLEIVGTCPTYNTQMNGVIAGTGYELVETEQDALSLNYMGGERGIYLYYCENVVLENIKINHINGSAIRVNHTGMDYTRGLNSCNLFINNCYNGIYTENEHEFSQYTNFSITSCMIGIYCTSGNIVWTAGHITRSRVGIIFANGHNTAHGIVNGVEFKHNQIAGIIINDVSVGEFFSGCYVTYCDVIIRNSTAVVFDTLMIGRGNVICSNEGSATGTNYIGKLVVRSSSTVANSGNLVVGERVNCY